MTHSAPSKLGDHAGPGLDHDVSVANLELVDDPVLEEIEPKTETMPQSLAERELQLRSLAELLADPDALKPPEAVVPRLAYRGRTTLVIGREKQGGKTTLCTAGAAAVTTARDFLDGRCAVGQVLWVTADQEHRSEIVQRAVRFGANPERFHVLWPQQPFADLMAALDGLHPFPSLVVIDTLASFARKLVSDPHSSAEWPDVLMPLVRIARDMDVAVQIIHHAKKGEGGGYRDSTAIGALVDMLLELTPDTGDPARRNVAVLGRWPAPNFAVALVGDHYQLIAGGELSLDARILLYIERHARCGKREVRDGVGGRVEDVDGALGRLLARGAVTNAGTAAKHAYIASAMPAATSIADGTAQEEESDDLPF